MCEFYTDKWNEEFIEAVRSNQPRVVDTFISKGIDVNAHDPLNPRMAAIDIAINKGHSDVIALLASKGACPTKQSACIVQ